MRHRHVKWSSFVVIDSTQIVLIGGFENIQTWLAGAPFVSCLILIRATTQTTARYSANQKVLLLHQ